jgi:hypothetical protein
MTGKRAASLLVVGDEVRHSSLSTTSPFCPREPIHRQRPNGLGFAISHMAEAATGSVWINLGMELTRYLCNSSAGTAKLDLRATKQNSHEFSCFCIYLSSINMPLELGSHGDYRVLIVFLSPFQF